MTNIILLEILPGCLQRFHQEVSQIVILFFSRYNGKIYSTIWAAGLSDVDLGAIEEAQIKLIKKRIKKNIKEELRPEAEEKAFACLEKEIGRSPVHRRRSTFGGGKSTRKRRKKRKTRKRKTKRKKKKSRKSKKKY
jgi:hypothetical protein